MRLRGVLFAFVLIGCRKTSVSDEADDLQRARTASAKLPQVFVIEPYGLEARVPTDWKCNGTKCTSTNYENAIWSLLPMAPDKDFEDEIRQREAPPSGNPNETTLRGPSFEGRTKLGELTGYVHSHQGAKRPEDWVELRATAPHPRFGRVLLTVRVGGDVRANFDEWRAIVMSTKVGAKGLADTWPEAMETLAKRSAAAKMAVLESNDASPEQWFDAARILSEVAGGVKDSPRLATFADGGFDAVTKIVSRRAMSVAFQERTASSDSRPPGWRFVLAIEIAETLRGWADGTLESTLDDIERSVFATHSGMKPERIVATTRAITMLARARPPESRETREALEEKMRGILSSPHATCELFTDRDSFVVLRFGIQAKGPKLATWALDCASRVKVDERFDHEHMAEVFGHERAIAHPPTRKRLDGFLADPKVREFYVRRMPPAP